MAKGEIEKDNALNVDINAFDIDEMSKFKPIPGMFNNMLLSICYSESNRYDPLCHNRVYITRMINDNSKEKQYNFCDDKLLQTDNGLVKYFKYMIQDCISIFSLGSLVKRFEYMKFLLQYLNICDCEDCFDEETNTQLKIQKKTIKKMLNVAINSCEPDQDEDEYSDMPPLEDDCKYIKIKSDSDGRIKFSNYPEIFAGRDADEIIKNSFVRFNFKVSEDGHMPPMEDLMEALRNSITLEVN